MAENCRRGPRRPRHAGRWIPAVVAALTTAGALSTSAVAQAAPAASSSGGPTIIVSADSVVATSLPSFGPTTITVTRPDAITGTPVVIGVVSGTANPFTPFSANTITPTPLDPSGDCWQKGALSEALTPDIQPGDAVTVSQAGFLGGGGTSTSTTVQPSDLANATPGPIAGCASLAPWSRNAITSAPSTVAPGDGLNVSGVAQPLATGVSVSASDGTTTTAPVSLTPAADGSWSATIPASELKGLADTALTVTPVMAVPDVSTGAAAHIAGVGVSVAQTAASTTSASATTGGATVTTTTTTTNSTAGTTSKATAHASSVRAPARVSLASARKHGVTVSFVVPSGVKVVQIGLLSRGKSVYEAVVSSHRAGTRQTIVLPARLAKRLHTGTYTLSIAVGTNGSALGSAVTRRLLLT
jgi:hypothetical protein